MAIEIGEAKRIFRAEKIILDLHPWVSKPTRDRKGIQSCFQSRVSTDKAMPKGVWFRITIFPKYPDVATFQMECEIPRNRSHVPLYRLDYKPIHTHSNGADRGPKCLRSNFFALGETHEHICIYHVIPKLRRLRSGGVHTARPVNPDFADFVAALHHVCTVLRIQNGDMIPKRDAQGELL